MKYKLCHKLGKSPMLVCLRFLALVFHLEQYGAVGDDEFVVTEVLAKEFF